MTAKPLWHDAAAIAARAHHHQIRKDGVTPYAAHPARVAMIVSTVFGCDDDVVMAGAFLHDVIEDCNYDYDDILHSFGKRVADIVAAMTKDMRLIEPEREAAYDRQLAEGPWEARLVKLADVYDNLQDALGTASKRKLIDRAERALRLAEGDPRLEVPSGLLRDLAASVSAELSAG